MRRALIALFAVTLMLGVVPASADHETDAYRTRIEVYAPVRDVPPDWSFPQKANDYGWRWQRLACDGTNVLDGVGVVRMLGFATFTGNGTKTNKQFRALFRDNADSWYVDVRPTLPAGVEVLAADMIQDLVPGRTDLEVKFRGHSCFFAANNVPASSEGFVSHRTVPTDTVESLRITLERYSDGSPIPCGSEQVGAGRVRVRVFATNSTDAVLDFHMHQERSLTHANGPDQDGDPANVRWWELAMDDVTLPAGVETQVHATTAITTSGEGLNTFHAAQQTGPGQPHIEVFCSFTNTKA